MVQIKISKVVEHIDLHRDNISTNQISGILEGQKAVLRIKLIGHVFILRNKGLKSIV